MSSVLSYSSNNTLDGYSLLGSQHQHHSNSSDMIYQKNPNNISLPPISAILRDIDIQKIATNQQQVVRQDTPSNISKASSVSSFTSISDNSHIPVLIPNDTSICSAYVSEQQTYKLQHHHHPQLHDDILQQGNLNSITSYNTEIRPQHIHQPQPQQLTVNALGFHSTYPKQEQTTTNSLSRSASFSSQTSSLSSNNQSQTQNLTNVENTNISKSTSTDAIVDTQVENKNPRRYRCKVCEKFFTTSGHLARHSRIHTGERKHVCPFNGCEARFARHDNCMQHYRTHKNPKVRRKRQTKKSLE